MSDGKLIKKGFANMVRDASGRAGAISVFLSMNTRGGSSGDGSFTAYELAKIFATTPQTIHNNMLRYGDRFGVQSYELLHRHETKKRKAIYKRMYRSKACYKVRADYINMQLSVARAHAKRYAQKGGIAFLPSDPL